MKLSELLQGIDNRFTDIEITAVTCDSRQVINGCAFVCIDGVVMDGHKFANDALDKGAAVIIVQKDLGLDNQIIVKDTRIAFAEMSANWFNNPAKKLKVIGVTGTNGKTSVSYMIKQILEDDKFNSSIYIMLDTLYYLKKGGRITPAAAALGTLLRLKPVLQIQGEKLDAFAKARTANQGKSIMINAIKNDIENRFGGLDNMNVKIMFAYTQNKDAVDDFVEEVKVAIPNCEVEIVNPLSLSVACHIGPGAIAVAVTQNLQV